MAGVSIVSGYSPAVAGVAFVNGAPPPGTTLYYRQGNSGFDGDPELPLDAICFAAGSLIATEGGEVAVEDLRPGMRVVTRDGGLQPVLWVGQRRLDAAALSAAPHLHPIRIRAGALGPDLPRRDLVVSPQHRILVRSTIAQRMFGAAEVLVAAKALLDLDGVEIAGDLQAVTYVHFLLPRHHVVLAEGLESESLLTGPQALRTLGKAARAEIEALLPGVLDGDHQPRGARPLPPVGRARRLAQRHSRNGRPLVQ
ncbi:hemolysin [Paracoccus limosus]|uniref:Hemolysin n=2 Tax=Paracoccus limosus TaxID=913252 RepID=A0A844H834_9RHOB|nr:hemolysin [Paracoccus limosus]